MAVLEEDPVAARGARLDRLLRARPHALPEREVLELAAGLEAKRLAERENVVRGVRAGRQNEDDGRLGVGLAVNGRVVEERRRDEPLAKGCGDVARHGDLLGVAAVRHVPYGTLVSQLRLHGRGEPPEAMVR